MTLKDLNTVNFVDEKDSVRMSVGWRNPQEDAYDVHSFEIAYNTDPNKCEVTAVDGYCFGSIPTNQIGTDVDSTPIGYRIAGVYTGFN